MSEAALAVPSSSPAVGRFSFFPTNVSSQNNFGLIRLALAVLVIFSHSFILARVGSHDIVYNRTRAQLDLGSFAVDCFFTISGFLIASSWLQSPNLWAYLRKRSLRIFPGLAAAVLFCILIVGPLAGVSLPEYFRNPQTYRFAQVLLMRDVPNIKSLPSVFHTNVFQDWVDAPLWTIRYEIFCYLLIPLLALCGLLKRRSALVVLFVGLLAAFHHCANGFSVNVFTRGYAPGTSSLENLPRLVLFFLAGTTFYVWRDRIPRSPILLVLALAALVLTRGHDLRSERLNLSLPLAGTYIIFYMAYARSFAPALSRLAQRSDLSYGVYLFGFPVQQLLVHCAQIRHVSYVLTPLGLFSLALPLALGLAMLSWKCVERPFLRLKSSARTALAPEPSPVRDIPTMAGTV